ncbi:hypothetical protein ACFLXV_02625 [Chloroflexota bacterium]
MKKFLIPAALLLALALILGTVGCGGDEGPTDEEQINELLDEQIAALNEVDLETVYNQRSPSYKSRVSQEDFENFILMAFADFLPAVESGQAEVEITDMEIRVEGEYAYMTGNLSLNGETLLPYTDESPDIWQKIDGTWYNLETNPAFPGYDASELPE